MAIIPGTDYQVVTLSESRKEAKHLIEYGFPVGMNPGFKSAESNISFRPGFTTLIYGPPHHGKSQIAKEFCINLSKRYGTKHLIRAPEWGSPAEGFVDLIQTYVGTNFFTPGGAKAVDIKKVDEAYDFVEAHFQLLPQPKQKNSRLRDKTTILDDYQVVEILQAKGVFSPNMLWIDHYKWWKKPEEWKNLQIADYVTEVVQTMNTQSTELNIHTVLLNHTASTDLVVDKESGKRYLPKPHMAEMAGGQEFSKGGQQILSVYRTTEGIEDKQTGSLFRKNQIIVSVDKSVPKGVGEAGKQVVLFFDKDRQQFYEEVNEDMFYGLEYESSGGVKPKPVSLSGYTVFAEEDEDAPF